MDAEKHSVDKTLHLVIRGNSKCYQAVMKVGNKWLTRGTGEEDLKKATSAAMRMQIILQNKSEEGRPLSEKSFADVAKLVITRLETIRDEHNAGHKTTGSGIAETYVYYLKRFIDGVKDDAGNVVVHGFGRTNLDRIDRARVERFFEEYSALQVKKRGKKPAQSTFNTLSSALMQVFDEAVKHKWLNRSQVPDRASKASGAHVERRGWFTHEEVDKLNKYMQETWIPDARNDTIKRVREMTYYYFNFCLLTGMRPGTEAENIRWSDIETIGRVDDPNARCIIHLKHGKTKGKQKDDSIEVNPLAINFLLDISDTSGVGHAEEPQDVTDWHEMGKTEKNSFPLLVDEKIWYVKGSSITHDWMSRNFSKMLAEAKMVTGSDGLERTLYSARHTYITWQLLDGESVQNVATATRTSAAMIEQHYSHISARVASSKMLQNPNSKINQLANRKKDDGHVSNP